MEKVLTSEEKKDFVEKLRTDLISVVANPSGYREGYAGKLRKMISAYDENPERKIIMTITE